jgi:hypothetical protein
MIRTFLASCLFAAAGMVAGLLDGRAAAQSDHELTVDPDINTDFLLEQTYSHGPLVNPGLNLTDQHVVNDNARPWIVVLNFNGSAGLFAQSLEVTGLIRHKPVDGEINLGPVFNIALFTFSTANFDIGNGVTVTSEYGLVQPGQSGIHDVVTGHEDVLDYVKLFVTFTQGIRGGAISSTIDKYRLEIKARHIPVPEPSGGMMAAAVGSAFWAAGRRRRGH